MRKIEFSMGMPITIDIPDADNELVFNQTFARFRQIDRRFSPFKKDSELSRYQREEVNRKDLSAEFKKIIKACNEAEKMTDGYFSANYSGKFDPSGYVKGWAIAEVGKIIESAGFKTYCIGAGGDILAASDSKKVWNIGIQDPKNPKKLINLNTLAPHQNLSGAVGNQIAEHQVFGAGLSISNGAVATSGNYERGEHIINPKTAKPANKFLSVTITGPDIITSDILATAVFAAGNTKILKNFNKYKCFVIQPNNK